MEKGANFRDNFQETDLTKWAIEVNHPVDQRVQ